MEIKLTTQTLVDDISAKYLMELSVGDPMPARGVIIQAINESYSSLLSKMEPFLDTTGSTGSANNNLGEKTEFKFKLDITTRRAGNKADALAGICHSYMVNLALCRIYTDMANAALASSHSEKGTADALVLEQLLYQKNKPKYED